MSEGYIKFNGRCVGKGLAPSATARSINEWRCVFFDLGLIGAYTSGNMAGVGFGNISHRDEEGFVITGSATGGFRSLDAGHFAKVTAWNFEANSLDYEGPIPASSESMTHAAIYEARKECRAVIHIHSRILWERSIDAYPTSDRNALYGTPEMAYELSRLIGDDGVWTRGLVVMGGHEDGLIGFGLSLEAAAGKLLELLQPREGQA
jgi:ribulose-5-phosphate 4-epimerase/fuculose-1-phosphate aldolase